MAMRGRIEGHDDEAELLNVLLEGMRGIMRSNGAKVDKLKAPKRTVVQKPEGDPDLGDLLEYFGGKGVISE